MRRQLSQSVEETGSLRESPGMESIEQLVAQVIDRVQERSDFPDKLSGLPTGFVDLDRATSGLQAGALTVLASGPRGGKTALALDIAGHIAASENLTVAYFTLGASSVQLTMRLIGSMSRVDQARLRSGRLSDEDWVNLVAGAERLRAAPLQVNASRVSLSGTFANLCSPLGWPSRQSELDRR